MCVCVACVMSGAPGEDRLARVPGDAVDGPRVAAELLEEVRRLEFP